MITLRESDGSFNNIDTSWAELVARPDFSANVDPRAVKLKAIVGSYLEANEVPCGLANCHQPHKRGYFVSIEARGGIALTNLGHVCGRNHFDVEFVDMAREFDRAKRINADREALAAYQRRVDEFDSRVYELRTSEFGADWAHKNMGFLRDPGFGIDNARLTVMRMVKSDDDRIMMARVATQAEIDSQQALGQLVHRFIEDEVGRLDGLFALRPENDLRQLLVVDLEAGIRRLSTMNVQNADETTLGRERRWAGEIEQKIERAEAIIDAARRLLMRKNLAQLEPVIDSPKERATFRDLIRKLN